MLRHTSTSSGKRLHGRVLCCWRTEYPELELGVESISKSKSKISEELETSGTSLSFNLAHHHIYSFFSFDILVYRAFVLFL